MVNFNDFKTKLSQQFDEMAKQDLFMVDVDKDVLWETYLESFPEGTNEIFRTRRVYDCQCCKQFIRAAGNVVAISPSNELVSLWDIQVGGYYQPVIDALSSLVKSKLIRSAFYSEFDNLGTDYNHQLLDDGAPIKWEHFHYKLPNRFVKTSIGTDTGTSTTSHAVFKRALEEITLESAEIVIDLIQQNSLYRGEEHKETVESFIEFKKEYSSIEIGKDNYCWLTSMKIGGLSRIKNTAIGTLLADISSGIELDQAVKLFESKVAPTNYKRSKSVVTKGMIEKAEKKVSDLGIEKSLYRRFANKQDITINNILFANRDIKKASGIFEDLKKEAPVNLKNLDKVSEVSIDSFISDIMPKSEKVEVLFENSHSNNLMCLIAPQHSDSPNILKWDNNFSWAYNGELADSMKQRVKNAGGKVDGDFRFSIQWNDEDTKGSSDLDAWCTQPSGRKVYYSSMRDDKTGCNLDIDITQPGDKVAVENVVIPVINNSHDGNYDLCVHNYSNNGGNNGFKAEFEINGEIHEYIYEKPLTQGQVVLVARLNLMSGKAELIESLKSTVSTKEIWHISTNNFQSVSMIMNSPNHWDGNNAGNKHYFFILDTCKNPDKARGFFNEYLNNELMEHRKVFEVLGSKIKADSAEDQLSGLGFSSTQRGHLFCKVTGSFTRIIKINF